MKNNKLNIVLNPSDMFDTRFSINWLKDLVNTYKVYIEHISAVLAGFVSNIE